MGLIDSLGGMAGGFDLASLAAKVGLTEAQVQSGLAALTNAAAEHGDTVAVAAAKAGLPADKVQALLAPVGGEGGLSAVSGLLGGGGLGSLGGMLGGR